MIKLSDKIRILHVVRWMNNGGLESRLMDLYREIDHDIYQFDFLCLSKEEGFFDEEIQELGGNIFKLSSLSISNMIKNKKQLKTFFKKHSNYKIVHSHLNQWSGIILKEAKTAKIPIRIAHSRTSLETINIKNTIKNIIKLPTNNFATHKMAVSRKAGLWLFGKKSLDRNEVIILPNAIKTDDFTYNSQLRQIIRKKYDVENSLVVMHVGNLKEVKNHMFLLDIFYEINKQHPNAKLFLIGEGSQRNKINKKIEEKNLSEDVKMFGNRNDVNILLQAADLFIFPSFYEGFPGSVLEAQASGLPCVISNTITNEVMITDRIISKSLKDSPKTWSEMSLNMVNKFNEQRSDIKIDKTYDIKNSARELINYYVEWLDEID